MGQERQRGKEDIERDIRADARERIETGRNQEQVNMNSTIAVETQNDVVRFAARELARYLQAATGRKVAVGGLTDGALFRLGLVEGSEKTDTIVIKPEGAGYFIGGSNPRSVLFAVY